MFKVLKDEDSMVHSTALTSLREAFGVDVVSGGYEEAARLLKERSAKQCKVNRQLEKVLEVVGMLENESGDVPDEDLYRVLSAEHGIDEDEAVGLVVQLIKEGLVSSPKVGYTRICI